jgi:UPF0148 protein
LEALKKFEETVLSSDEEKIRSMADMLRSGATLTDLSCPACSSPIFRMKDGTFWCAQCEKRVIIVKEGEHIEAPIQAATLHTLESTLLAKIGEIEARMKVESDVEEIGRLSRVIAMLLEDLEKVRKIGVCTT